MLCTAKLLQILENNVVADAVNGKAGATYRQYLLNYILHNSTYCMILTNSTMKPCMEEMPDYNHTIPSNHSGSSRLCSAWIFMLDWEASMILPSRDNCSGSRIPSIISWMCRTTSWRWFESIRADNALPTRSSERTGMNMLKYYMHSTCSGSTVWSHQSILLLIHVHLIPWYLWLQFSKTGK